MARGESQSRTTCVKRRVKTRVPAATNVQHASIRVLQEKPHQVVSHEFGVVVVQVKHRFYAEGLPGYGQVDTRQIRRERGHLVATMF